VCVKWIHLALDWVQWRVLVSTETKLGVSYKAGICLAMFHSLSYLSFEAGESVGILLWLSSPCRCLR
jgi:hypothetical protein